MSGLSKVTAAVARNRGLTLAVVAGVAILLALGSWQMQRRSWKEGLIAQIAARAHAAPMTIDEVLALGAKKDDLEYRRVRLSGRFLHEKELHMRTIEGGKPGWNIITPLETARGLVLVNRGFVSLDLKDRAKRAGGLRLGDATVTGLVRVPAEERAAFVPENRPAGNEWFWLDLLAMQRATGLKANFLPFVVAAERVEGNAPPLGGATLLDLPNRHLEYALTWYGLAVTLLMVYATYLVNAQKSLDKN